MELKIGEKVYEQWVQCDIVCVEDKPGCCGCTHCVFGLNGAACPERVATDYPCYHSDRSDGKDVHYERA